MLSDGSFGGFARGAIAENATQIARLRSELQSTRAAYVQAAREFDEFSLNVQSGAPGMSASDGATAISTMARKQQAAFERYRLALYAFTACILIGSAGRTDSTPLPPVREPRITAREMQVLGALAAGKTTKEIARDLNIAFKTALTHRSHLLQKFDANNVALLVTKAITQGYIEP